MPANIVKNPRPCAAIAPVDEERTSLMDWLRGAIPDDRELGNAVPPADWDDVADDGLYDDLA